MSTSNIKMGDDTKPLLPPKHQKPSSSVVTELCDCLYSGDDSALSDRKKKSLQLTDTVQEYLKTRQIMKLVNFLITKVMVDAPRNPADYLLKLITHCLLFRSGMGGAPVLYETKHIKAMVDSFDPTNRGYLTSGQVRRLFQTLGLELSGPVEDRVPVQEIIKQAKRQQIKELFALVSAGSDRVDIPDVNKKNVITFKTSPTKVNVVAKNDKK